MKACFGNGEVLANAEIESIIFEAAADPPRIVLNAANDVCCNVL